MTSSQLDEIRLREEMLEGKEIHVKRLKEDLKLAREEQRKALSSLRQSIIDARSGQMKIELDTDASPLSLLPKQ